MQVSVETTSGLERRVTIQVPAAQIDEAVEERLKQTAKSARINGFRRGKVPMSFVRRQYGNEVRAEVVSEVMRTQYVEAITQEKLNPAGYPEIDASVNEAGKDLEFVATLEVYPEVEVGSVADLSIEKPVASVSDEDLDKMIEVLREQQAKWNEVDRAATEQDQVNIDFEGFIDGEAFEGGKAEGHDLGLSSGTFIPGFEAQLVGAKAGEEKDVNVTFPEDYQAEQLKGKDAVFKVKVNKVSEQQKPELDDDFFKLYGVEEGGLEAFRADVKKNMERELEQTVKSKVKEQVVTALVERNEFDVPKALVSNEIDALRQQAVQQFGGPSNFDASALPAELFQEQAEKRVKLGLLMAAVVEAKELKADDTALRAYVEKLAESYQDPQQVVDYYMNNEQMRQQLESAVLEEQVVENLLNEATVNEVAMSYDDAIKPAEQNAEAA
ncbi:trigger factor [Oceanospirillum linum]|uniref:Trigger factor n=1 Tax=Oceanospirillum linum TaxID=966 RepID=A0A1T1HD45_OCELI|nr:trigger factor [Oceanospirillum linum]OOV87650.1 trigger factor [Oceanospirillum linum]SEF95153.1 trigger factor [Oleiphilus messinensis]SMP11748.1 trigger factor [Oceanospirillum linum]